MQAADFIDDPRVAQLTAAMHKACAGKHIIDIANDAGNQYTGNLMTWIDTGEHHWLNFRLSDEDKLYLFICGAQSAKEFCCEFNW